jgi:hypothetical protein
MRLEEPAYTSSNDNFPLRLHLVVVPTRHKLDHHLGNSGIFFILDLRLEQCLGGLCAGGHDKMFPVGIWLEIYPVCGEDRVPDLGSTALAGVKKPVALPVSWSTSPSHQPGQYQKTLPAPLLEKVQKDGLRGFKPELVLVPKAFAAAKPAMNSWISPG